MDWTKLLIVRIPICTGNAATVRYLRILYNDEVLFNALLLGVLNSLQLFRLGQVIPLQNNAARSNSSTCTCVLNAQHGKWPVTTLTRQTWDKMVDRDHEDAAREDIEDSRGRTSVPSVRSTEYC